MYRETFKLFIGNTELLFVVTGAEFVDTSCSINQLHLTGIERVRSMRDFQLYKRVFVAIFPFYGFAGVDA